MLNVLRSQQCSVSEQPLQHSQKKNQQQNQRRKQRHITRVLIADNNITQEFFHNFEIQRR